MEQVRYETAQDFVRHVTQLKNSEQATKRRVLICCGTGCLACGAAAVAEAFEQGLAALDPKQFVELNLVVKQTGCHGFCQVGPILAEP